MEVARRIARAAAAGAAIVRDLLLTPFVVLAVSPLWFLPWRAATKVGRWYGHVGFFCWPVARRAGMINLRRAYGPPMTRQAARRVVWAVFGNLGASIAEGLQFARRFKHAQPGWEELYEAEDPELERSLLADPRPKVFVTGHLGSWEFTTAVVGLRAGRAGAAVVRRVDNPFLNAIVRRVRVRHASQWIEKHGAAREALDRLRQGHSIAMLVDENGGARGLFPMFFGRPASTRKTAALLSIMTGAPIIVGAAVRRPGHHKLLFKLARIEPSGRGPEAIATLTEEIVRLYESWVREYPLQWRWIHWRWKSRPDGSEESYGRRDLAACFREADRGMPDSLGDVA